jgi:hypothetical protein
MAHRVGFSVTALIACICQFNSLVLAIDLEIDLTQYVNPFIGTEGRDSGIDNTAFDWTNVDANAGYTPDGYGGLRT